MENYYDESTDEEFGMDLQLAERLLINQGEKNSQESLYTKHCSDTKKDSLADFLGPSSSSSSLEMDKKANNTSGAQSSYLHPNKKRQNGDKIREHLANPKRTCLNGRLHKSSSWKNKKSIHPETSHNSGKVPEAKFPYGENYLSERDLSPDQIYENNLKSRTFQDSDDSDFEIYTKRKFTNPLPQNHSFKHPSLPSSSKSGVIPDSCARPSISNKNTFHLLTDSSDSDNNIPSVKQNGALKGGKQSPDCFNYNKKVLGRRIKVLDSDDSENEATRFSYRARSLKFSSSDSEDAKLDINKINKTESLSSHSYSQNRDSHKNQSKGKQSKSFPPHFKSNISKDTSSSPLSQSTSSPDFQNQGYRPIYRRRSRNNKPHFSHSPPNFMQANRTPSAPVRGRNRMNRCERTATRSSSPNFRMTRSQHRAEMASSSGLTRSERKCDLSVAYPELFDAEDSSEVEFFTANSYSDTETSNESPGLTINATFVSHNRPDSRNNTTIQYEHSINVESSEDEISVLFSSAPRSNSESRRGSRGPGRRGRRGRNRRHQNEVVSLSPDPVEQVRQMEDDERYARILQAQFDAELDPSYVPYSNSVPHLLTDSDDDDVNALDDSDSSSGLFLSAPPLLDSVPSVRMPNTSRRGLRISHSSGRGRHSFILPSGVMHNRRQPRNRRRTYVMSSDSFYLPIPRILNLDSLTGFNNYEDDYEALLELVEANGDAVQRGLEKSEINRLPTRKYTAPNSATASGSSQEITHRRTELNKECQVCLCDYETGDVLRILPCFHEFHTPCIDPWLKINHTCPVCRVTVDVGE